MANVMFWLLIFVVFCLGIYLIFRFTGGLDINFEQSVIVLLLIILFMNLGLYIIFSSGEENFKKTSFTNEEIPVVKLDLKYFELDNIENRKKLTKKTLQETKKINEKIERLYNKFNLYNKLNNEKSEN